MEHLLWYKKPASCWNEALPTGNGRLGAMVWGKAGAGSDNREILDLNEDTLWYGSYKDRNSEDALENLPRIRELLFEGKPEEAQTLAEITMSSKPKYFGSFQPMGRFFAEDMKNTEISDYKRSLDLDDGVIRTEYKSEGVKIKKEYFVSLKDDVIVFRISSEKKNLDFFGSFMRRPQNEDSFSLSPSVIGMESSCGKDGVNFTCLAKATGDGQVKTTGDYLVFSSCSEVIIRIAAHSDFYGENPRKACLETLEKSDGLTYEELYSNHIKDYKEAESRAEISFSEKENPLPTDERLMKLKEGERDNGLLSLYYRFARYLMISSSRPGTNPMNLQGIWNDSFTPAWECNYTININTQMNYWIAESGNLSEFHEPLFDLIERMLPNGEKTAEKLYGVKGFVAHHCTNIWGDTAIEGNYFPSPIWPMGGAWLSLHLMEHYDYTGDREFLRNRAMPVLRKSAEFFHNYMTEDGKGSLVTGPSISPENVYITSEGREGSLCMGPKMDMQIVWELFSSVIRCSEILGEDREFALLLKKDLEKIRPLELSADGTLMEWNEDYKEKEPGHRHISHLFALYPGTAINKDTPVYMKAAEKTIEKRLSCGGGHTGWSRAWISCLYGRLYKADKTYESLNTLLKNSTYINLLDVHPPFQIDGNIGGAAAISGLLLFSTPGEIELLPALPSEIPSGYFKGLCAKGGFRVSAEWKNGRLIKAEILSLCGNKLNIKLPQEMQTETEGIKKFSERISIPTEKNKTYIFNFS